MLAENGETTPGGLPAGGPGRHAGFAALRWAATALAVAVVAGVLASPIEPTAQRLLAPLWIASLALFLVSALGAAGWRPSFRSLLERLRAEGPEIALAMLVVALAFALRTVDLPGHPNPFVNDEGRTGLEGAAILAGERPDLLGTGWAGIPMVGFLPYAASELAFGRTVFAVRFVSAVEGTLGVLFVWLLGRGIGGRKVGLLAAAFAATLPLHLHFSRLGVPNVADAFLGPLVLGATLRAVRDRRVSGYLFAGLAAGAALYVYPGSRLLAALSLAVLCWQAVLDRRFLSTSRRQLLAYAAAFLFTAGPILAFFARRPDVFMGRINSQSILHNGWLQDEALRTGRPASALLAEQASRTLGAYVATEAPHGFFNSSRPYLFPLSAAFCLLGMARAVTRVPETGPLLLVVWFWSVVVLGSVLMVSPPSSERLVQSVPPLAVFFGLGVQQAAGWLRRPGRTAALFAVAVAVATGLLGAGYYFGEYRSLCRAGNPVDEAIQGISLEARGLGPGYGLHLIGVPGGSRSIPNFRFLVPDVPISDVDRVTPALVASLPPGRGAYFAVLGRDDRALRPIAGLLPGGEWKSVRRAAPDEVCYTRYVVPPARIPAGGATPPALQ